MKLSLGFSPCPNDCFIFDAMVHHKIDTEGLEFEVVMEDVEALNQRALKGELDITKLSFHAYLYAMQNYILLRSGSALGFNCGPLLVGSSELIVRRLRDQLNNNTEFPTPNTELSIAIPGKNTTANFLLSLCFSYNLFKEFISAMHGAQNSVHTFINVIFPISFSFVITPLSFFK